MRAIRCVQRHRQLALVLHCDIQMVLEILTHRREVDRHWDVVLSQVIGITDPREQEKLWGVDGAAAHNHFPVGIPPFHVALSLIFDTDHPFAFQE